MNKTYIIAAAFVLALLGCGKPDTIGVKSKAEDTREFVNKRSYEIDDICIDGVVYLRDVSGYSASITVKYDAETLTPQTCRGIGIIKSR